MNNFVDVDIRKVYSAAPFYDHPIFMSAHINYDKALKNLTLTNSEGQTWIFADVELYDINEGFTHLRGINCEDNGAVCSLYQICVAYMAF